MKRCPLSAFDYENEQGLCDMDGSELVIAPSSSLAPLPNLAPLQPSPQPSLSARMRRRSIAVLSLGVLICGAIFTWTYYAFTHEAVPQQNAPSSVSSAPKTQATSEQMPSAPSTTPDMEVAQPPAPSVAQAPVADVKTTKRAAPLTQPAPKPTPALAAKQEARQPKPEKREQQKESGVVSLLKKTGRVLKKPFKL